MTKRTARDIAAELAGGAVLGVGAAVFALPAKIAPGGVTGAAIIMNYLTRVPIGTASLAMNIPLLLIAYMKISPRFAWRTLRCVAMYSLMMNIIIEPFVPQYSGDRILAAVTGGVLMGAGLGIVFSRDSSTGGTDILGLLIEKKFSGVPIGRALLLVDGIILAASAAVFRSAETVILGMAALFCQSRVIDAIVYGPNKSRSVMIISEKSEEIAAEVIKRVKRGATLMNGVGAYTGKNTGVLLCVINAREFGRLKRTVTEIDPNAFMTATEAAEVLGEGFSG